MVMSRDSGDVIELGASDPDWHVRVYCSGRDEVARVIKEEGIAEGVERYLVQFWPQQA